MSDFELTEASGTPLNPSVLQKIRRQAPIGRETYEEYHL
jgi:hypothetical protein